MLTKRLALFVVLLSALVIVPSMVLAAGLPIQIVPSVAQGSNCTGAGGCTSICDIAILLQNILNTGIFVAVFLSAILFAWAGLRMLTAAGSSSQVGKAKDLFYNVLIGFIIILAAWLVVNTLMSIMVTGSGGLPWNRIC